MSLRDEAITHMAERLHEVNMGMADTAEEWEPDSTYALDALLDFLDAHTEEWRVSDEVVDPYCPDTAEALIDKLRDDA